MAQHGATQRHTTTANPPSTASDMRDRITLTQPRPDGLRSGNYYTETPLRPHKPATKSGKPPPNGDEEPDDVRGGRTSGRSPSLAAVHRARISPTPLPARCPPCVTFTKEKKNIVADTGSISDTSEHLNKDSIMCSTCNKCKCEACKIPRSLPSRWICNSRYECSAEALLDTCTCMCCVKGIFYHCTKDYDMDDDVSCADRPCSCSPDRRCMRWSCMGTLALILPCLLCYWPMKGCLITCESCYARYHNHGCQCNSKCGLQNTQRLLDPNNC